MTDRAAAADRFSENNNQNQGGNGSNEKVSNLMMANNASNAGHHNAHFSDKEDGGGPYEGGAAAHGSSGKKKTILPVAAVPQVSKPTSIEDFEIMSKLGDGAYSSVYRVKRIADGDEYALKKVKLHHLSDKEKENAINEVRILASLKNPNIIQYKEAFLDAQGQALCIVMEYADNGDLFQKISEHQKQKTTFAEQDIWRIFIQVVRGLKAMHDLNIMHRDLKSANVFLYKDFTSKLGDMNVSKVANKRGLNYTQTGTPYYASPEVWRDEPYDIKSDIWSLGCVLYEIIALKPPFTADDMQGLYKKVLKGHFPRIPKSYSHDLWTMCKTLIQVTPSSRPNCEQIMSFPTFSKKFEKYFPEDHLAYQNEQQNVLLKTIKFPKNLMYLSDRLPKQNYKSNHHGSGILSLSVDLMPSNASAQDQYNFQMNQNQYQSVDLSNQQQNNRQSRKNISNVQLIPQLQGGSSPQKGVPPPQQSLQPKELRLPSIQNIKQQQYMNQIQLGVGGQHLGGQQQQQQDQYSSGREDQFKKRQQDRQIPSVIQKPMRNNSKRYIQFEAEEGQYNNYRSNSTLGEDQDRGQELSPNPQHRSRAANPTHKKSSIQMASLEILSEEESRSKGTDRSMLPVNDHMEVSQQYKAMKPSPSEKRYRQLNSIASDGGLLPMLMAGNQQIDLDMMSQEDNRHASPGLIRKQASKKVLKNGEYSGSQKHLMTLSPHQAVQVQRLAGIYNSNQGKNLTLAQQQQQAYLSPSRLGYNPDVNDAASDYLTSLQTDRMRVSPQQRVNDLVSKYNVNNIKKGVRAQQQQAYGGPTTIGNSPMQQPIIKGGKKPTNVGGTLSYSIAPSQFIGGIDQGSIGINGRGLADNPSQAELMINSPTNIVQQQQKVVNAIQNAAKSRKTRNSNSKSIIGNALLPGVQTNQNTQQDNDASATAMIAATHRFTNKTTVEQELMNSHPHVNIGKANKNPQGFVLPQIHHDQTSKILQLINPTQGSLQNYGEHLSHSLNVSPVGAANVQKILQGRIGNNQSPKPGKKTQRQMVPGYPYLQLLPRGGGKDSVDNIVKD